ncbi:MAG: hypothetical protein GY820_02470 [Gammaproteobacteria bacterium]|nr:hypothetical protein [Gammaproteobacteria bacterium]
MYKTHINVAVTIAQTFCAIAKVVATKSIYRRIAVIITWVAVIIHYTRLRRAKFRVELFDVSKDITYVHRRTKTVITPGVENQFSINPTKISKKTEALRLSCMTTTGTFTCT